jgi:hypothetical protein
MMELIDSIEPIPLDTRRKRRVILRNLGTATRLSVVAAVLLLVSASAGLLYGRSALYPPDPELLPQFFAQDAIALLGALPALLMSMWLTRRGSIRGLVVWLGVLVYIAYWYHFYLVGIPFGALFLVHVALVSSCLGAIGVLLFQIDVNAFRQRMASGMPARTLGRVIAGLGTVFAIVWVADTIMKLRNGETLDPVARSVYAADLTLMLPLTIAAGVGLWQHRPWGYLLAGPLLVNAFASMLTLLSASILVDLSGESTGPAQLILFPVAALVMLLCTTIYLRDVRRTL